MDKTTRHKIRPFSTAKMAVAMMVAGLLAICLLLAGCTEATSNNSGSQASLPESSAKRAAVNSNELQFTTPSKGDSVVKIETNYGTITAVLYEKLAPLAVENFKVLAEEEYYNGTLFHRVKESFVIQGGEKPEGEEGTSIWGHPFETEFSDLLHHYAGALCMAPNGEADTHETQFYIVAATPEQITEDSQKALREAGLREAVVDTYTQAGGLPYLDNTDTVFGQVIEGMDVVDEIAALPTGEEQRPKKEVQILSVTLSEYGADTEGASSSS